MTEEVVIERIREQRNHFKEMADVYRQRLESVEAIILRIDCRMGHGWTLKLAEALTPTIKGSQHE